MPQLSLTPGLISSLPESEQPAAALKLKAEVGKLTEAERAALRYAWSFWARPEQLPPPGNWQYWSYIAGRGAGKALALDTPIPTPSGWSTMGDLQVGDLVIDENGKPCRVLAKYEPDQKEQYRITFSDGSTIDACADHLWVTWEHKDRKAYLRSAYERDTSQFPESWVSWKPTRHSKAPLTVEQQSAIVAARTAGMSYENIGLAVGVSMMAAWQVCQRGVVASKRSTYDDIGPNTRTTKQIAQTLRHGKRGDLNHCIPCAAPIDLPEARLPIPPYTLGAWLGDGSRAGAVITSADDDVITQIRLDGYVVDKIAGNCGRASMYSIRHPLQVVERNEKGQFAPRDHLLTALKRLGVCEKKSIPAIYLRASINQRIALLRGLMDTDGHASGGPVEFCNTNENLARGVFELAVSLGEKPVFAEGRASLNGKDCGPKYRVTWTPASFNPFAVSRKAALVKMASGAQGLRRRHRMIVSVDHIDPVPVACLTVDSPNSMYLAGRSMIPTHNTRTGAEWVRRKVREGFKRIALVAPTHDDFVKVMVAGESGILSISPPWDMPEFNEGKKLLTWPNGAQAFGYSAERPERLRGPQHDAAWADELAAWHRLRRQATWDMLNFGMRIGTNPQVFVSTTPMPVDVIGDLIRGGIDPAIASHVITRGSTYANKANLAPSFLASIVTRYEGTRLGRQELLGELLDDVPGALWTYDMIDNARCRDKTPEQLLPLMRRVVVSVDPSGASNMTDEGADEIGIIVAGEHQDGSFYVLADRTLRGSPQQWARAAVRAFHEFRADKIVAESNFGGDMVRHTIANEDRNVPVEKVTASRGKAVRAEPIAHLYEQGRVHHVGTLPQLEDQMIRMTSGGYMGDGSPDRLDAAVWALSDLSQGASVTYYGSV